MKITTRLLLSALLSVPFGLNVARGQSGGPLVAEFDRIVASEFQPGEPGGVILVAREGEVVYRKAFGMANIELDVPMREEMVFNIGSVTKPFTAVAVLQLAEQGKLSLSDELTKYLPDFAPESGKEPNKPITLRMLTAHRSGLVREPPAGNYFDDKPPSLEGTVKSLNGYDEITSVRKNQRENTDERVLRLGLRISF